MVTAIEVAEIIAELRLRVYLPESLGLLGLRLHVEKFSLTPDCCSVV
jgi:hypothetical protein